MTYHFATTPEGATKDLSVYTPSIISSLFSKLIGAIAVSIEAERDIEHVNVFDMAINHWLRDAEVARDAVTDVLTAIRSAAVTRGEDKPLVQMAGIVDDLMGSETLGDYLDAQKQVRETALFLRCNGFGKTPSRITQMLRQCHVHLTVMSMMDVYQPDYDPEDLSSGLSEAWPEAC